MAQTGYTPILIYSSSTASNAPAVGNLTNSTLGSELAINITDGKLFYKDNANAIQVIGWKTTPTSAGGTGLTSYTAGDLLYYASGTTLSKLAIGTSGRWLGSSGTAPQWNAPAALTKTNDTNVTLTLGGSASTALLNAASLTLGWTGTLATTRGGTGLSSFTANGVVYANSSNTLTTGSALVFDGTSLGVNTSSMFGTLNVQRYASSPDATLTIGDFATPGNSVGIYGRVTSSGIFSIKTAGVAIRLSSDAGLANPVDIFDGNVIIGTSGKGIDFSATPGTGTSELFADYEEGTWTPVITGSSSNPTISYQTQSGYYTIVGRTVTCQIYVQFSGSSGGSGDVRISLPSTPSSAQQGQGACAIYNIQIPNQYCTAAVTSSGAYVTILGTASNGAWSPMQVSALKAATATQAFSITVSYIV